jgi:hypothetical protein
MGVRFQGADEGFAGLLVSRVEFQEQQEELAEADLLEIDGGPVLFDYTFVFHPLDPRGYRLPRDAAVLRKLLMRDISVLREYGQDFPVNFVDAIRFHAFLLK